MATTCTSSDLLGVLTSFVAAQNGLPGRLLKVHRNDGHGHCRACSLEQSGTRPHPCVIRKAALSASRRR